MTKEKIIRYGTDYLHDLETACCPISDIHKEFVREAIKALEQQSIAEERYQDLVEYFGDKDIAKCVLEDREEFKKWLERVRWNTKKVDELARKLEQQPSDDCVSREGARQFLYEEIDRLNNDELYDIFSKIIDDMYNELSSVTPKIPTSDDCVSREQALLALTGKNLNLMNTEELILLFDKRIKALPPVTPTQRWIPIERREPTQEEKTYYKDTHGEELSFMLTNQMPSNGQEVLVTVGNTVSQDTFFEEFYNFEGWDISDVDAWQPLPKPYEEKRGN